MGALAALLAALAAAVIAANCGSTSVTETAAPDDIRCQTSINANPSTVGAGGGTVSIAVNTTRDCAWTATSGAAWIHLSTGAGQGEATFTASVDANPQIVARNATVTVNGHDVRIAEEGRPCTYDLKAASAHMGASGGAGRIDVTTLAGCTWQAATAADWIQVSNTTHTGSGSVDFRVSANNGTAREAIITVADHQFVVSQDEHEAPAPVPPTSPTPAPAPAPTPAPGPAPDCTATLQPTSLDVGSDATTRSLHLDIAAACSWSVSTTAGWLSIASAGSGLGAATIRIFVMANSGDARSASVRVAGAQATLHQAAAPPPAPVCSYTLDPASATMTATGGSGHFSVSTQSGCTWTASSSAMWIAVTHASGTGTGDVTFSVEANSATTSRSGTIAVGGHTFSISQAGASAPCTYSIAPTSHDAGSGGGAGTFTVTTSAGCTWTASTNAAWVTITSGASGSGSGDVAFSVAANSATSARSGTITAAGQTFTINQAAASCTYAIDPASLTIAASGGDGRFTMTTQSGCAWTATSDVPWVTMTTMSGTGPGDVMYHVQPNTDASARTGTVTAGGQTHTVNQSAPPPACTYTIDPSTGTVVAAGGQGQFKVTTQDGCAWNATTSATWITIGTESGMGTGNVVFTAQANPDAMPRSATIGAAGQTYTLNQDANAGSGSPSP
jgi:hypothetical protein